MHLVQIYSCFCLVLCHTNTPLVVPCAWSTCIPFLQSIAPTICLVFYLANCMRTWTFIFCSFCICTNRLKHGTRVAVEGIQWALWCCWCQGLLLLEWFDWLIVIIRWLLTCYTNSICESHYRLFHVRVWLRETAYFHTRVHKNGQVTHSYALLSRSAQLSSAQHDDITYQ